MKRTAISLLALLSLALACGAQAQINPGTANLRFSAQVSNAPPGTCGCFGLEGVAGDAAWNLFSLGTSRGVGLGVAGDLGVVHTGQLNGANYGLTLTTFTAGPRLRLPGKRLHTFGQALFGVAHGSGSQFPSGDTLVSSANSFALDLGGGADYSISEKLSLRAVQIDYLRTSLPNILSDWQNNLRIGVGVTVRFGSLAKR
ncbi:MAG: outer membrane beta-barrel protein [Terracidiphilus sp.]